MKNRLFLCNTVYQVIIATWMKYYLFNDDNADIIISNHMNGYKEISKNIKKTELFNSVFIVDSLDFARNNVEYKNSYEEKYYTFFKNKELEKYIKITKKYDELFTANVDSFTALFYNILSKKNTKLNIFEDGIATYSKLFEKFYLNNKPQKSKTDFLQYDIFRYKPIFGNVDALWLLNPNELLWKPDCPVKQIPPIKNDEDFRCLLNMIFNYQNAMDVYDKKYIYFEECYFAETGYMEDVELINTLAEKVGKENIMIKIHPRNPENRFEKLGYKTNKDTFIPWEVILMNNDFSDKVLIAIGSQTILTPYMLFGMNMKSYSLYHCLKEKPDLLNGPLFDVIMNFYNKYNENIIMYDSVERIGE